MLLNHGFGSLGAMVGQRPLVFFLASTALFITSFIILAVKRPDIRVSFDEGYTTRDAPSIKELQAQIDFFGNKGTPWYMALFAEPRSINGSMTGPDEFKEMKAFYKNMKANITIRVDDGRNLTYLDFCDTMCDFNEVIFKTYGFKEMMWWADPDMQWPVTSLLGYKSNIGKYFFERKMKGDTIESSRLFALYLMVFVNGTQMGSDMSEFERLSTLAIQEHNANPLSKVILTQHSARGMQLEIMRGTRMVGLKGFVGVGIAAFFTLLSLVLLNRSHGRCTGRVLALFVVAFLLPLMSLISAVAFFSIFGRHLNTLFFLSPFVIFAVALDGMFLIYNIWLYETNCDRGGPVEQMREVFASALPSVSLVWAPMIALIFGSLFPIPEFANLSFFIGTALVFVYLYQVFFFAPAMVWFQPIPTHRAISQSNGNGKIEMKSKSKENGKSLEGLQISIPCGNGCACPDGFCQKAIVAYCRLLANSTVIRIGAAFIFFSFIVLPSIFGAQKIHGNLDYRHLLPPDSPNNMGVHFMSDKVWPEFLHVLFIIEKPPNFSNPKEYARFMNFIHDGEHIDGAISNDAHMVWIYDFNRFANTKQNATSLNMTMFKSFITDDIYKAWNSGVQYRFDENGTAEITKMIFMVGIEGTRTMADKARLLKKFRKLSAKYPEFHAVPFDTEVGMADVITQIPSVIIVFPLFIFMFFFFAFLALSANIALSVIALLTAVSVYTGCVLWSSLLGVTLNPFSVAFLLFVAVVSYKGTAHLCLFYRQVIENNDTASVEERVRETLRKTLLPSVLSLLAGCSVFLPLLFTCVTIFRYLAFINLSFLLIGLLHSVLFVPVILVWLPSKLTGPACFMNRKQTL